MARAAEGAQTALTNCAAAVAGSGSRGGPLTTLLEPWRPGCTATGAIDGWSGLSGAQVHGPDIGAAGPGGQGQGRVGAVCRFEVAEVATG